MRSLKRKSLNVFISTIQHSWSRAKTSKVRSRVLVFLVCLWGVCFLVLLFDVPDMWQLLCCAKVSKMRLWADFASELRLRRSWPLQCDVRMVGWGWHLCFFAVEGKNVWFATSCCTVVAFWWDKFLICNKNWSSLLLIWRVREWLQNVIFVYLLLSL